jgi:hypothetical protein
VKRLLVALLFVAIPQCGPSGGSDGGTDASDGGVEGGCAHDCLGGACVSGMCQPIALVKNLHGPITLTQMSDRVFWTDYSPHDPTFADIASADKVDGGLNVLAGYPIADGPWGIVADDSNVFVANSGAASTILRCTPNVCDQSSVLYDGGVQPTVVALAGNFAYWMEPYVNSISRMPKGGGAVQSLAQPNTSSPDAEFACIVSDGTYVYWSEPDNDKIMRQAVAAQPETVFTLAAGSFPSALLIDSGVLYFTAGGSTVGTGYIGYGNPDGSGGAQILAQNQRTPWTIVTDATYIYWTNEGEFDQNNKPLNDGTVSRCEKTSCKTPVELANNLADPHGLVVDDTALYFATTATGFADGTIWRLAK